MNKVGAGGGGSRGRITRSFKCEIWGYNSGDCEIIIKMIINIFWGVKQSSGRNLTHCGRVTQICVFNTVKLGTSASSP